MSLSLDVRRVPPTLVSEPSRSVGPDPADWADIQTVLAACGLELDPWQEDVLRAGVSLRDDGRFSAFEVAGVVPRQNGKGGIMYARQLAGLFVFRERLQIHTAHEFKTSYEHFLNLKNLVQDSELNKHVRIIRTGAGDQAIELKNGCRIRFLARSRTAGRGFSADCLYLDEAFELTSPTMGAILPTLSARPNPQVWYFSSAPHYNSEYLHSLLKRADEGGDPGLYLAAWENPRDTPFDDVEAWRRANPAIGFRISEEYIADEMRALSSTDEARAEFARERLGIREGGDGEGGVIDKDQWASLVVEDPSMSSVCYGLAAGPDWVAVGSAGRLTGGHLYVDTVEHRAGTEWVVDYVADLHGRKRKPIRIDPSGSEGMFIRPLEEAGVEVVEVPPRDYQQACGEFAAAVSDGTIHHLGQDGLTRAAVMARKREVGKEGGWVWDRPSTRDDITTLKAATLALTGVTKHRPPRIH